MKLTAPAQSFVPLALAVGLLFNVSVSATAGDVSGKWTSIVEGFRGQPTESSLTLKQDGAALSGTYESGFGDSEIEEGKAEGGAVSFKITRTFGDREMVSSFAGKLDGKAIKGTLTVEGRDGPREIKWEAYRAPEIDPTGLWKFKTASGRDGSERDNWVKLQYAKGALTGTYKTSRGQAAIVDPALEGKAVSFKVVRRWRDREFATAYKGTLDGNGIKGSITSRRGDEERKAEWAASIDTPDADPVGTWAWTSRRGRDGEESTSKITIKREGDALVGNYRGRGDETPIENVKLEGNVLSFQLTTENDRGKFTSTYSGAIDEDLFDANVGMQFGERKFNRPLLAKRELAPAKPEGVWKWSSRRGRGGEETVNTLTLKKSDDGSLSGSLSRGDQESPIADVKLEGNDLTFTSERTWGDNKFTLRYSGIVRGDAIDGTYQMATTDTEAGSGWESFWTAKRSE